MTKSITIISTLLQWTPESNFLYQLAIIPEAKIKPIKTLLRKVVLVLALLSQHMKHRHHTARMSIES